MLRSRPNRSMRTTLNLADAKQVKSVRKRFGISDADLVRIVDKIGNSLAAIQKEAELERAGAPESGSLKKESSTAV